MHSYDLILTLTGCLTAALLLDRSIASARGRIAG